MRKGPERVLQKAFAQCPLQNESTPLHLIFSVFLILSRLCLAFPVLMMYYPWYSMIFLKIRHMSSPSVTCTLPQHGSFCVHS